MKTLHYLLYITIGSFILSSCGKQLELSPLTGLDQDMVWASEANAMTALMGCYKGNIPYNNTGFETDWCSYSGLMFIEFATDNAFDRRATTTGNSTLHQLTNGSLNSSNGSVNNFWSNSYLKIARCNRLIENIDKVPASQAAIDCMKSEARFLRAMQYFYMSQYFGSVPLVTKTLTPEEANKVTKATNAELIRFCVDEFSEIVEYLPNQKDVVEGRACKQAALAFLGRTYLSDKQWSNAAATYKRIIDMGENIIDADYQTVFFPSNKNSLENIFSTQYLENLAGNSLPQHAYPAICNGWHIVCPLGSLWEAYEFIDGTPFSFDSPLYDPADLGKNRDPRLTYTLLWDQTYFKGKKYTCHPDSTTSLDQLGAGKQTTYTGFGLRKTFDEGFGGSLYLYGGNAVVIRYAEILLSYLEAELEAGTTITQQLLDATINKVRGRETVRMPAVTELNPDLLRPVLRNERRVELALEGQRYWDLLRWGIAHEVLNGDFYGAPFPGANNMRRKGAENDPHSRWFVISRSFRNPQDYLWPIPQGQQDINPNLR